MEPKQTVEADLHFGNPISTPAGSTIACQCFSLAERLTIVSSDRDIALQKIYPVVLAWNFRKSCEITYELSTFNAALAEDLTTFAQNVLADIKTTLTNSAISRAKVDWSLLKRDLQPINWQHEKLEFIRHSTDTDEPDSFETLPALVPPDRDSARYATNLTFFDHLFASRKRKKIGDSERAYQAAMAEYESEQQERERTNASRAQVFREAVESFAAASSAHEQVRGQIFEKVDAMRVRWQEQDPDAIQEASWLVLMASQFGYWFSPNVETAYRSAGKMLIVEYKLPRPSQMPTLESVKFIKSRNSATEKRISESQCRQQYDDCCYQLVLRAMHEIFSSDEPDAIDAITINGWVEDINPSSGQLQRACVLTVQTTKKEFQDLNLAQVNAKSCFKSMRGIAATSLTELAPVAPILCLDRNDARFVSERVVSDSINKGTNLAAMHWEDFEHLVRELFAKVFSGPGAEVRVTQASRDGGVDAIALDPDPIRGGKIIIQAKRYTNVVGVSAVRDLYGTVQHEGANRGILVTTSDYGPDAYEFAKGKPISLLNGNNLLALLADHGHAATIDIAAARKSRN